MSENQVPDWLKRDLPRYEKLTDKVYEILSAVLSEKQIYHVLLEKRTKTLAGILDKIKRKGYPNPEKQLTDISGLRIIVNLDSQISLVSELIKSTFSLDLDNCEKKDNALSVNQVGYRSEHYICNLGGNREGLPEHSGLSGLKFEIQLRTVLQHAWAEVDHGHRYKLSAVLPKKLQRELFLYAGLLEIADNGFSALADKISSYQRQVETETRAKKYDSEIDSISFKSFVGLWCEEVRFSIKKLVNLEENQKLVDLEASSILVVELKDFGLKTVGDLKEIIPGKYVEIARKMNYETTIYGLIRDWMILSDFQKYRNNAWKKKWSSMGSEGDDDSQFLFYSEMVGQEKARLIFKTFE